MFDFNQYKIRFSNIEYKVAARHVAGYVPERIVHGVLLPT